MRPRILYERASTESEGERLRNCLPRSLARARSQLHASNFLVRAPSVSHPRARVFCSSFMRLAELLLLLRAYQPRQTFVSAWISSASAATPWAQPQVEFAQRVWRMKRKRRWDQEVCDFRKVFLLIIILCVLVLRVFRVGGGGCRLIAWKSGIYCKFIVKKRLLLLLEKRSCIVFRGYWMWKKCSYMVFPKVILKKKRSYVVFSELIL